MSLSLPGFAKGRVYAITPPSFELPQFLPLLNRVLAMGKVAALQLRLKDGTTTPVEKLTEYLPHIKKVCTEHKVPLVVNDVVLENEHVHLGSAQLGKVTDSKHSKQGRIVGISCGNSIEKAQTAAAMPAVSYVSFGAFYPTATKSDATPCGLSILSQPATQSLQRKITVVAIGGINASNGQRLIDMGVSYLAICSALWQEPKKVLEAFG